MGSTREGYDQRALLRNDSDDYCIVGMAGRSGEINGSMQFTRLGLLEIQRPSAAGATSDEAADGTVALKDCLWDKGYATILGYRIWDHPSLKLYGKSIKSVAEVNRDLIPQQALIWASNERELRGLRRLSGNVIVGGHGHKDGEDPHDLYDLRGVSAEFAAGLVPERRFIGMDMDKLSVEPVQLNSNRDLGPKENQLLPSHFEIDGAGGEIITEVRYVMAQGLKVIEGSLSTFKLHLRVTRTRSMCGLTLFVDPDQPQPNSAVGWQGWGAQYV